MTWWRKHWRWLLIVGGLALGVIAVALVRLFGGRSSAAVLEAKLVMADARAKISGVEADKRVKQAKLEQSDVAVQRLQDEVFTIRQHAKQKLAKIDGLSAEQLAQAFSDLGY